MSEQNPGGRELHEGVSRDAFFRNPTAVLKRAEAEGSVVVTEKSGAVHSLISVPNDDRPIVE